MMKTPLQKAISIRSRYRKEYLKAKAKDLSFFKAGECPDDEVVYAVYESKASWIVASAMVHLVREAQNLNKKIKGRKKS